MNKNLMAALLFLYLPLALAQTSPEKPSFPPVNWVSNGSSDEVTIQNGNGAHLIIQINVIGNQDARAPGIDIKNCGKTTHVKAGSSAICTTSDAVDPVTFSSESNDTATGTYQIKQE